MRMTMDVIRFAHRCVWLSTFLGALYRHWITLTRRCMVFLVTIRQLSPRA